MASCILYQNDDATISIIDIPRSIEIAQGSSDSKRRLLSSEPLAQPYPSVEPKSQKARERLGELSLNDLLLSKHLQFTLDEVTAKYESKWCLPRDVLPQSADEHYRKRKKGESDTQIDRETTKGYAAENVARDVVHLRENIVGGTFYQNQSKEEVFFNAQSENTKGRIPPNSTLLCGDIATTKSTFITSAPEFDLIILDPPWPNRSALRKKSYGIAYGNVEVKELLSSIMIHDKLAADGTVGVWITNREAFREMLLQSGGLFDKWGITFIEECIWLKTTVTGEPICPLDSVWRKPYEILLVGRRGLQNSESVKRRVIIGVPDLHSRKPNLKPLFDQIILKDGYKALEVFARNLTIGWWAWGFEVLKFQMDEYWIEET